MNESPTFLTCKQTVGEWYVAENDNHTDYAPKCKKIEMKTQFIFYFNSLYFMILLIIMTENIYNKKNLTGKGI